ncbi:MAG TPA: PLP-dependent aminotransferase family protein [Roseiflexaceae bacterium]|nr:PLP-dependent aminotransferase family protein [Roseiflexaceae bacterium]
MATHTRAGAPALDELYAARARTLQPAAVWPEAPEGAISLSYGFAAPELFPTRELHEAAGEVLFEDADAALNYGPTDPHLVALIVERMRARGIAAEPHSILVTHGSSQALGLLPQVLVDPGDTVLIEGPSFMGAVRYFAAAGARLVTVPTDEAGLDVEALEDILRELRARGVRPKFLYTIPTYHNPTGTLLPLERRKRLVALAAEHGLLVVEDDAYGELGFEGEPATRLAALDEEGWVLHVSTFSKILAPGVRVGFACGRPEIIQRLAQFKIEGGNGPFITRVVERFCAGGRLDAHIQELRALYRRKRDVMLEAMARELPPGWSAAKPQGGFFIWCRLPQGMSAQALHAAAAREQVVFEPGTRFFANGQGDDAIRLAFSFQSEERLAEGIRRIGAAMRALG